MRHPGSEVLLSRAEADAAVRAELAGHLEACAPCRERLAKLEAALARAGEGLAALEAATPAALEGRLGWRLRGSATTLRAPAHASRFSALYSRFRGLALAAAAVALVVVGLRALVPPATVSAAEVLERSRAALLAGLSDSGGQRIAYRLRYQGPSFESLPDGAGEYRIEQLSDSALPGSFKLTLTGPDGGLVRGLAQAGDRRRIQLRTSEGSFDMRFALAREAPAAGALEARRQQVMKSLYGVLLRAAEPQRITHVETEDSFVVELGPAVGEAGDLPSVIEIEAARLEVDRASYRVSLASVVGRALGEPFRLDAELDLVEALPPGQLRPQDFELAPLAGAVELEGAGSQHVVADAIRLLLKAAAAGRPTVAP